MKCSNTLTIEDPEYFYMVSKASTELADQYHAQAEVRDQDNFNMYIYNDFTGYGLQEVIENQLTGINSCIIKRPEPRFVDLWIRLSAFAHWTADRNLVPWTMIDDSLRWNDTVAMIGYATIATLNALDRAGLLRKDSPIKDLGFVLSILGDFLTDCFNLAGGIPWISKPCEACWPYKIVQYAKENGITINGVRDIEGRFVKKHDDEILAGWWKRKPCIDRWGWNTKVSFPRKYFRRKNLQNSSGDTCSKIMAMMVHSLYGENGDLVVICLILRL